MRAFLTCMAACLLALPVQPAAAAERAHTAGSSVSVLTPPQSLAAFGKPVALRIYLPPDYAQGGRRYPVLYMFDGQNLFDDATSYVGEWGVDETMDALAREDGFEAIVVGLDHGNEQRVHELIPYPNERFAPAQGGEFLDGLVKVIKPLIDASYRTLPDRANTAIIGSSLGGLEADYAIHRYPDVFGKAGVFSPAYWVAGDQPYAEARKARLPADARVYLYMGGKEGDSALPDAQRMAAVLRETMPSPGSVTLHVVDGAEHNETAWRAEFPRAVRWLFGLQAKIDGERLPADGGTVANVSPMSVFQ